MAESLLALITRWGSHQIEQPAADPCNQQVADQNDRKSKAGINPEGTTNDPQNV
jgi:hypothetical protein